ncbi:MAG: hypothetical protein HRT68_14475 [Flavobacteriaceae bacterium]|nr:hypothetical protein [Flavobacteriaceae bacterium]
MRLPPSIHRDAVVVNTIEGTIIENSFTYYKVNYFRTDNNSFIPLKSPRTIQEGSVGFTSFSASRDPIINFYELPGKYDLTIENGKVVDAVFKKSVKFEEKPGCLLLMGYNYWKKTAKQIEASVKAGYSDKPFFFTPYFISFREETDSGLLLNTNCKELMLPSITGLQIPEVPGYYRPILDEIRGKKGKLKTVIIGFDYDSPYKAPTESIAAKQTATATV